MSIGKFSSGGVRHGSAAHVDYILRDSACDDVSLYNLKELEGADREETKTNCISYAKTKSDIELPKRKDAVTHYRGILSWNGKEDTEKAREMAHQFLKDNFKNSRAIVAVHQDTNNTHVHLWVEARQTNEKKIHMNPEVYKKLDEKWTQQYDRKYGTNYAPEYKAKKEQTKEFTKGLTADKRKGKKERPPNKPPRYADGADSKYFREKEARDLGVTRNDENRTGSHQRPFEVRDSAVEKANHAVAGSEQHFAESKRSFEQSNQQIDAGKSAINEGFERANQEIDRANSGVGELRQDVARVVEIENQQKIEKENDRSYER